MHLNIFYILSLLTCLRYWTTRSWFKNHGSMVQNDIGCLLFTRRNQSVNALKKYLAKLAPWFRSVCPFTICSKRSKKTIYRKRLGRVWPDHNPKIIADCKHICTLIVRNFGLLFKTFHFNNFRNFPVGRGQRLFTIYPKHPEISDGM